MPQPSNPISLTLARAMYELLSTSGATMNEQQAAVQIVETLIRYLPEPADSRATSAANA